MTEEKNDARNAPAAVEKLLGEKRRPWYVRAVPVVVVLALAAGGAWWWQKSAAGTQKVNYVTERVVRGPISVTVSADGTLKPTRTVTLGSELSGIVRKVNVDVNDSISAGDVLIELDTRNLESKVASARASLASAKAQLAQNRATLNEAEVKDRRLKELNKLSGGKMPSRTDLDAQEAAVATARAALEVAKANIADAEASLSQTETDLSKAMIKSPIDGVVLARSVEPGYAVAASLQAVELLSLATDLSELELQVNVDEADIGSVQAGQKAFFTVSAYPDKKFPATLTKVAFGSTTTENVVTYTTYLDVKNPELQLRPGMTASATISTAHKDQVLLVPNSALRFMPNKNAGAEEASAGSGMRSAFMSGPPRGGRGGSGKTAKEESGAQHAQRMRTLYVLRGGEAVPVTVTTGLTDGAHTEIVSGEISESDAVIVDQQRAKS